MISKIAKIWRYRHDIRSILISIYFNFHYLPLRQAIHLPVLLYKPRLLAMKGKVVFAEGIKLHYGMVRMGFPNVSIYPNTGIAYENKGGTIYFNGVCYIGNNSAISVSRGAYISLGNRFVASTSLKIVNYCSIDIGTDVRIGWDCLIMDTDLHKLTKLSGGYTKGYGPIKIGSNCWIANGCKIMKRTELPNYCIVSAGTILSGKVTVPEYSIIGTSRDIKVFSTGIYRNLADDKIEYR